MAEPGTPRLLRGINDRAALDLLLEHGPLSAPGSGSSPACPSRPRPSCWPGSKRPGWCGRAAAARADPARTRSSTRSTPTPRTSPGLDVTPAPDPGGRGRHHRPDRRRVTSCRHPARPRADAVAQVTEALDGACRDAGRRPRRAAPAGDRHTGRVRPRHAAAALRPAPARLARPRPARPARRRGRRCPSTVDNDVNLAAVAELQPGRRPGQSTNFVLLWARGGPGRGDRHRRPPAPGAPPAAPARSASCRCPGPRWSATSAAATPAASRSSPAASRCSRWPGRTGIRAGHRRGRGRAGADHARRRRPAPGRSSAHRLALGLAADRRGARPGAGRAVRRRAQRRRRAACATSCAASWPTCRCARPPARAVRRTGRPGAAPARCTPRSPPPGTHVFDTMPGHRARTAVESPSDTGRPTPRRITMAASRHRPLTGGRGCRDRRSHSRPACTGLQQGGANDDPNADVTITFWHGWSAPSEVKAIQDNIDAFEKAHPNIHVKAVGNITDDKINQALRAGGPKAPDVVSSFTTDNVGEFCTSHAFVDLDAVPGEVRHRPGGDVPAGACSTTRSSRATSARCRCSATPTASTTTRTMFAAAGITAPPKTLSEFDADAVKLTKTNGDSLLPARVHAELPRLRVDDHALRGAVRPDVLRRRRQVDGRHRPGASRRRSSGRSTWSTPSAATTSWRSTATTFGDEFGAKNPFMTGQVAMAHRRRVAGRA